MFDSFKLQKQVMLSHAFRNKSSVILGRGRDRKSYSRGFCLYPGQHREVLVIFCFLIEGWLPGGIQIMKIQHTIVLKHAFLFMGITLNIFGSPPAIFLNIQISGLYF